MGQGSNIRRDAEPRRRSSLPTSDTQIRSNSFAGVSSASTATTAPFLTNVESHFGRITLRAPDNIRRKAKRTGRSSRAPASASTSPSRLPFRASMQVLRTTQSPPSDTVAYVPTQRARRIRSSQNVAGGAFVPPSAQHVRESDGEWNRRVNVWDSIEGLSIMDSVDPPPPFTSQECRVPTEQASQPSPSLAPRPTSEPGSHEEAEPGSAPVPPPHSPPPAFASEDESSNDESDHQEARRPAPMDPVKMRESDAWERDRLLGYSLEERVARMERRRLGEPHASSTLHPFSTVSAQPETLHWTRARDTTERDPSTVLHIAKAPAPICTPSLFDDATPPDSSDSSGDDRPAPAGDDSDHEWRSEHDALQALYRYESDMREVYKQGHMYAYRNDRFGQAKQEPAEHTSVTDEQNFASLAMSPQRPGTSIAVDLERAPLSQEQHVRPASTQDTASTSDVAPGRVAPVGVRQESVSYPPQHHDDGARGPTSDMEYAPDQLESDLASSALSSHAHRSASTPSQQRLLASLTRTSAKEERTEGPMALSEDPAVERPNLSAPALSSAPVDRAGESSRMQRNTLKSGNRQDHNRSSHPPPPAPPSHVPMIRSAYDQLRVLQAANQLPPSLHQDLLSLESYLSQYETPTETASLTRSMSHFGGAFTSARSSTAPLPAQMHLPVVTDETRHFPPSRLSSDAGAVSSTPPESPSTTPTQSVPESLRPARLASEHLSSASAINTRAALASQASMNPEATSHASLTDQHAQAEQRTTALESCGPRHVEPAASTRAEPEQNTEAAPVSQESQSLAASTDDADSGAALLAQLAPRAVPQEEITDLELAVAQLDSPSTQYEWASLISDFLGPAREQTRLSPEDLERISVGRVELEHRRVTASGQVRVRLTVAGIRVDRCGICLEQFRERQKACILPCFHMYVYISIQSCTNATSSFHNQCTIELLRHSRLCPVCRQGILPAS